VRTIPARVEERSAFTLLELLIVLVLLTVIAALSTWAYFSRPEVTLDNAIRILARDLRIAQNRAILLRRPVSIVFAEDGDGYKLVDRTETPVADHSDFERIERRYSRDAIFEGVRILPVGLAAKGEIVFPFDSTAAPPGRIMVSYRDETRTLEIENGTGRILLTDHDHALAHGE
jgi:prepilin-type N-terminal cleavage/methylation domain-containing protein